jgi:hypothetical protein
VQVLFLDKIRALEINEKMVQFYIFMIMLTHDYFFCCSDTDWQHGGYNHARFRDAQKGRSGTL